MTPEKLKLIFDELVKQEIRPELIFQRILIYINKYQIKNTIIKYSHNKIELEILY